MIKKPLIFAFTWCGMIAGFAGSVALPIYLYELYGHAWLFIGFIFAPLSLAAGIWATEEWC